MITAHEILLALFNPDEKACIRVFDDRKTGTFSGAKIEIEVGKYLTIEKTLKEHNEQNRGIFYVVNYGGHEDKSISRINAHFVEMDDLSFEEQQAAIDAFPLPPSIVMKTRKSLHVYWLVTKADVSLFRPIQKKLVAMFKGDPMCINESRVLRLPGFYHCKKEPVMVECVSFHPEYKYTQEQLMDVLPEIEECKVERKSGNDKGLEVVLHECEFIKHCRNNAASLSEHDWYAMISNLANFEGGVNLIHQLSAPYADYSEKATQKKINHYFKSDTGPMTCATIAEKGFVCPRMTSGECTCKAPAALCYEPLSIHSLTSIISDLKVTGDTMTDVQAVKRFISDYLYNQDIVTADAVISIELKKKYKFNNTLIRTLTQFYKETSRNYASKVDVKAKKKAIELPAWYTVGQSGLKFLPGVLGEHMAQTIPAFNATHQFFFYNNGVYTEIDEEVAEHMVQEKMLTIEMRMAQIVDATSQWKLRVRKDIRELNPNPYIINAKNGLYNVLTDTFSEHSPDYLSTLQLNTNYDPNADCPRFKQFLAEAMGGDMDQVKLLQEILGYFLVPITKAQKCILFVGVGAAGKSVLLRVLNEVLLGRKNVSNVSWQALNERFKTAELFNKLANIFSDLPTKKIDDNGIFKCLVGEDIMTVERKHQQPFAFQNLARLIFSCNNIPKNYGDRSDGFYRRLVIIRFNHSVPPEKRDPNLLEKFYLEADGIFMFALEGLKRLLKNNFIFSETEVNRAELEKYREESDSVLSFLKECCKVDKTKVCGSTELFNAYKSYCEECGLLPCSQKTFVQQIISNVPSVERGVDKLGARRILIGIHLGEMLG